MRCARDPYYHIFLACVSGQPARVIVILLLAFRETVYVLHSDYLSAKKVDTWWDDIDGKVIFKKLFLESNIRVEHFFMVIPNRNFKKIMKIGEF